MPHCSTIASQHVFGGIQQFLVLQERGLSRDEIYFMDIGANVGWYSINMAVMGYNVIAFEPMTPN